jgi:hypothetical protein
LIVPFAPYQPILAAIPGSPITHGYSKFPAKEARDAGPHVVLNRYTISGHIPHLMSLLPTLGHFVAVDGEFSGVFSPLQLNSTEKTRYASIREYLWDVIDAVAFNDSYQWGLSFFRSSRSLQIILEMTLPGRDLRCTSYPKLHWLFDPSAGQGTPTCERFLDRRLDALYLLPIVRRMLRGRAVVFHDGLRDVLHLLKLDFYDRFMPQQPTQDPSQAFADNVKALLSRTLDDHQLMVRLSCLFCQQFSVFKVFDTKFMYARLAKKVPAYQEKLRDLPQQHNSPLSETARIVANFPADLPPSADLAHDLSFHVSATDALATACLFDELMNTTISMSKASRNNSNADNSSTNATSNGNVQGSKGNLIDWCQNQLFVYSFS